MVFKLQENNFGRAVAQIKEAIRAQGLKVVAEISTSEILKGAGFDICDTHQIFFFRPDFMKFLIDQTSDGILNAPLKIVIRKKDDATIEGLVQWPSVIFKDLKDVSFVQQMDEQVKRLIKTV